MNSPAQPLENLIPYAFRDSLLLEEALTHSTYRNEQPGVHFDNERLEYLGDAVISLIAADWLFRRYPDYPEGKLTKLRAVLANRHTLAEIAQRLGIGPHIRLGRGLDQEGAHSPTILCDSFEALVGAIYLDGGLDAARDFFAPFIEECLEEDGADGDAVGAAYNPKGRLQEYCQRTWGELPEYRLLNTSGPEHERVYEYQVLLRGEEYGRACARNKQAAQAKAARGALEKLGQPVGARA